MRFNMIITYSVACALGFTLAGCSSLPFSKKEEVKPAFNNVQNTPEWFFEPESETSKFIVVTATDVSKDMQFAIDKATINAKIEIASRLKTDVDSMVRESSLENGYGVKDVEREIDRVSKLRVSQSIGFFKREKVAVIKEDDHYRAFVMFKISVDDARRLTFKPNTQTREDRMKELDAPTSQVQQPTDIKVSPLPPNN
jgi:hypothetical protein